MFSSTKIGRFGGIDVFIHPTFWLLIGWIFFAHLWTGEPTSAALSGVLFILLLFLCVVLHEFGHAIAARRFGVQTRDITLYPIGGVARLERIPEERLQEFWIAVAGPAVNVLIAGLLTVYLALTRNFVPVKQLGVAKGSMVERIMIVNIILVVFNLLPAFPMDGGRMLRSVLAIRLSYGSATNIAAAVGKGMAFVFGFVGLFTNPILLFIAFFVWIGASGEAGQVQFRELLRGVSVSDVMTRDFRSLSPDTPLGELRKTFLTETHRAFPVVEEDQFLGLITDQELVNGLRNYGEDTPVKEIMNKEVLKLTAGDMLETVLPDLQEREQTVAPVMEGNQIVGLVTNEQTGRFLMLRASQNQSLSPDAPGEETSSNK